MSESHTAEEVYSARVPSLSAAVGSCWSLHILLTALLTQNTLMTSPLLLPCHTVKSSMFPCEEGRRKEEGKNVCPDGLLKKQWISIPHYYTYTVLCYHDTQLMIVLGRNLRCITTVFGGLHLAEYKCSVISIVFFIIIPTTVQRMESFAVVNIRTG